MKKRIKRMMKNGLITLIVFSLFFGCGDPFSSELSPITFELDAGLYEDGNGFHHLMIDMDRWQTLHRLSGHVYRNGEPINIIKFGWSASHYWYIGDTLGYVIANHGLSDDLNRSKILQAYDRCIRHLTRKDPKNPDPPITNFFMEILIIDKWKI